MLVSDYLGILWLIQVETKLSEILLKYLRSVELFVTNFYRAISNFYFSSKRFIDLYSDDPVHVRLEHAALKEQHGRSLLVHTCAPPHSPQLQY